MKKLVSICLLLAINFAVNAQNYPKMIAITGGTFIMGGTESNEKPTHTVTVSGFSMGKYEVTVAEYKAFCTAAGRTMPDAEYWVWNDKYPIVNVNFNDANAYCNWLSQTTGQNYRLPTEAEWEYAARGGNKSSGYIFSGDNDLEKVGWSGDNSGASTQAVGRKNPNELGLYDMSGNIYEWCIDWFGDYTATAQTNPSGANSNAARVLRGGSWLSIAPDCRVANRYGGRPEFRGDNIGFRVVFSQ